MRTRIEIHQELDTLRELAETAPTTSRDEEDLQGAINAQITVIERLYTWAEVQAEYDEDDFVLNAAVLALRWLRDDDEAPSEKWEEEMLITA